MNAHTPGPIKGKDRSRVASQAFRIAAKIARRKIAAKHTPGPWGAQTMFDNNLTIGIDYPDGDERDHFLATVTCGDPDELQANANLIQGAPYLLLAAQKAFALLDSVAFVSEEGDTTIALKLLRVAIGKVTGEPS